MRISDWSSDVCSSDLMGAAGLTSSSVEMASKGGVGLHLKMDDVPQRESAMTAYEMMLSESQERMLMVLKHGREDFAAAIFHKWELDRSDERRVGKAWVRTCSTRWAPDQ